LSEDTLVKWHEHISKSAEAKGGDPAEKKVSQTLRDACNPFIEWLKNAESESDEDYY